MRSLVVRVFLAAVVLGVACRNGELSITAAQRPPQFASLGASDVYVDVQGTRGRSTAISLPFAEDRAYWYMPRSLRLAQWDPAHEAFRLIDGSAYDIRTGRIEAVIDRDGLYTIIGLLRSRNFFLAQLDMCRAAKEGHEPPWWRKCQELLCGNFDYDAASDAWFEATGRRVPADSLESVFESICKQCENIAFSAANAPECALVAAVDMKDTVAQPPNDADGDGLNNMEEVKIGTNPFERDTDGDGLLDPWEVVGFDVDGNGTPDVDLPGLGVDPRHKDVLVELDWMYDDDNGNGVQDQSERSYGPMKEAIDYVVARFAEAPVGNPDGNTGIHLIVIISDGMPKIDLLNTLIDACGEFTSDYQNIKSAHMTPGLVPIARYSLWIDIYDSDWTTGYGEIPGDDFVVSLGGYPDGASQEIQQGTFMHELGHTLGLYHSGTPVAPVPSSCTDPTTAYDRKFEMNYPSVMNFFHQFHGVTGTWSYHPVPDTGHTLGDHRGCYCAGLSEPCPPGHTCGNCPECTLTFEIEKEVCFVPGPCLWTYSSGGLPDVNEGALDERNGISPTQLPGPIDWNLNGTIQDTPVGFDVQGDGHIDVHTDHDDWSNLALKFW